MVARRGGIFSAVGSTLGFAVLRTPGSQLGRQYGDGTNEKKKRKLTLSSGIKSLAQRGERVSMVIIPHFSRQPLRNKVKVCIMFYVYFTLD